ncbi:hypothetical protein BDA99DRAFT_556712 [Phascolomyces articulosus]|uniref:RING-type domain-containing protein n=1 Tax=Phascolomyces articulosus TaxID=60185 RepID=A0AAD5K630_9FUNG|nr:hypothetical protein BDA99DRAFT_556712 [Phascolomyces articulosus]
MSNTQHLNTLCLYQKLEQLLITLILIHLLSLSIRNTGDQMVTTGVFAADEEQLQINSYNNITTGEENSYDNDLPQLILSQYMVSVDNESKEWYEDTRMPHNEWQDSILAVVPFHHNWDGNLVYLHTSCPETLSITDFPLLNNQSTFAEQILDEDYDDNGLLRRVAIISRGDTCSWSTKVSYAQSILGSYNLSLAGIILYDNAPSIENKDGSGDIKNWPENDLPNQPVTPESSSTMPPVVFVNQAIGQILMQSLYYVSNSFTAMSKVLVLYEKLPLDPNSYRDKKEEPLEKEQSKDRLILAGQLIVNSIAVMLVIILIAYACHRFRRRQQILAARRMMLNNGDEHHQPTEHDRNSTTNTSLIDSTTSSFLAIMRQRHGSVQDGHEDDQEEVEEAGIGRQQLESKFPKINYDPLIIRNSTCAICFEDFSILRRNNSGKDNRNEDGNCTTSATISDEKSNNSKLLRRLQCGHGFCVSCIDPWLSDKSRNCPLCKRNCIYDFCEGITKPERAHSGNATTSSPFSITQHEHHTTPRTSSEVDH